MFMRVYRKTVKTMRPNVKGNLREGKGFSLEELKLSGLNPGIAKRHAIVIDKKRKTINEENVKVLKYLKENMGS